MCRLQVEPPSLLAAASNPSPTSMFETANRCDGSARFTPLIFTNYGMRAFTMFDLYGNEIRVGSPERD